MAPAMYVCVCNALSERKVRETAARVGNAQCASDIFRALGAEPECGKCAAHAVSVYRDEAARHHACR